MEMKDFLEMIGINKSITYENGVATILLDNSNEYAKMYTILTETDTVELEQESVVINQKISSLKFSNREFEIVLSADLERDIYKLLIEEVI
jgi:hypothetical protein